MGILFENGLIDIFAILATAVGALYYYLTSTYSFWDSKNIPYIKPEIFYGNVKDIVKFKKSHQEKFVELYQHFKKCGYSYGGLFELRKPFLLLCSPDIIQDVMVKNFTSFHDRGLSYDEHFDPLTANLVMLDGQRWKYLRTKAAPAFTTGKLRAMIQSFVEAGEPLLRVWDKACETGESLDMRELMAQYTTDVIGICAFGLQMNSVADQNSSFRNMGRKVFEPSKTEKFLQILRNVYPWIYKTFKLRIFSKEVTDYFIGVLRETMDYRRRNKIERNDFLDFLMKLRDSRDKDVQEGAMELSEGVIAAQAFIFFLAGFETSSTTLSFCLYELALNPEIQEKIQKEVDSAFEKHKAINLEFLHDLKYTEQVIQETLRKHPPIPLLLRLCTKPYKLPDSNVVLQPGTQMFIPTHSLHHDPEFFPEPQKFDPERFSPENKDNIVPFTFVPFGEGPRVCIGMRFAMLEMKTILAELMSKFKVATCDKTKPFRIDPRSFILRPIDGIWLKAVRRESSRSQ